MAGPGFRYPPAKTRLMIAVKLNNNSRHYSISSEEAFNWTMEKIIRHNFGWFKLILVYVQHETKSRNCHFFSCLGSESSESIPLIGNESAEPSGDIQFLEAIKARCNELGIDCETRIKIGDPKKEICAKVKRVRPDLLIVGNRNRSAFQKRFFPNVSDYCAKHAECPVVRIKRKAETDAEPGNPAETDEDPGNLAETVAEPGNPTETDEDPGNPAKTVAEPGNPTETVVDPGRRLRLVSMKKKN